MTGQSKLTSFDSLIKAKSEFEKKFLEKTGNNWSERNAFKHQKGKYDLIRKDYEDTDINKETSNEENNSEKVHYQCDKTEPNTTPKREISPEERIVQKYELYSLERVTKSFQPTTLNYGNMLPEVSRLYGTSAPFLSNSLSDVTTVDFTEFIGTNTTVERLIVWNEEVGNRFIPTLGSLKNLDLACVYRNAELIPGHVEEITCILEPLKSNNLVNNNVRQMDYCVSRGFFFGSVDSSRFLKIEEYFEKLDRATLLLLFQEYGTQQKSSSYFGGSNNNAKLMQVILQQTYNVKQLDSAKHLIEFILDQNYPIEISSFFQIQHANQVLFEYVLYLANEYQDGRLFVLNQVDTSGYCSHLVLFGWHFWKQSNELPYIFVTTHNLLSVVLDKKRALCDNDMCSVLIHALCFTPTLIGRTLAVLLDNNAQALYNIIVRSVQCNCGIKVPILGLLLKRVDYCGFLLERTVDEISEDLLKLVENTSRGDNLLHIYLSGSEQINPSLLLKLMKRMPHLTLEKNNLDITPLDLTQNLGYVSPLILKEIGIQQ